MSGEKEKRAKTRNTVIVACIALAIYAATKLSIVSCGEERFLAFSMRAERESWTLYPVTLRTPDGEIHLKAFTKIKQGETFYAIINKNNSIKHNLIVWGNKLNENPSWLEFYSDGKISGFGTMGNEIQKFIFEGFEFEVSGLYYDGLNHHFNISDFAEIILKDGTRITPGPPTEWKSKHMLELLYKEKKWQLFNFSGKRFFIAENSAWKKPLHIRWIEFEENWGKVLDYGMAKEEAKKANR